MKMNDLPFDPFNVTLEFNPPCPHTPVPFSAWEHIGKTVWLDPRRVKPMDGQPRSANKYKNIGTFGRSIKEGGQLTDIMVFPINHPDFDVELIAGERRTRGCRSVGIMIRAAIKPVPKNRAEHFVKAGIENFNRVNLDLEERVRLVREYSQAGIDPRRIAVLLGETYNWVTQYMTLDKLIPEVRRLLEDNPEEIRDDKGRKLRRTAPLTMSIALHVAKLPPQEQFSFAMMTIEESVPIEAARHMVKARLADHGIDVTRSRSVQERMRLLERGIAGTEMLIAKYGTLPHEDFLKMAASVDDKTRDSMSQKLRLIARRMRKINETMLHLAFTLDPKIDPNGWHPKVQEWFRNQGVTWKEE